MFVPGAGTPAAIVYGKILAVIRDEVQPVLKDLEVYAGDRPPANYGLELEVEGIRRAADTADVKAFHLVGASAGGLFSLAFAAKYPERLMSLALMEPVSMDRENWSPEERAGYSEIERIPDLPPDQRVPALTRLLMPPGVKMPPAPPAPPPAWMANRPAGLEAIFKSWRGYSLDLERFRRFQQPVYLAIGSLSPPWVAQIPAKRLARVFPNIRVEVYEGRHHLDPPPSAEPERMARALRELWAKSEAP